MELTKQGIDNIHLKSKNRRYYYCEDVDKTLDEIAEAVDAQQKELGRLKELEEENMHMRQLVESHQSEIQRLKQLKKESPDSEEQVARMLLSADKVIQQLVEEGRKGIKEERQEMERQKLRLQSEIKVLMTQKMGLIMDLKQEADFMMASIEQLEETLKAPVQNLIIGEYNGIIKKRD